MLIQGAVANPQPFKAIHVVEATPEVRHARLLQMKIIISAVGEIIQKTLQELAQHGITQHHLEVLQGPAAVVILLSTAAVEVQTALVGLIVTVEVPHAVQADFLPEVLREAQVDSPEAAVEEAEAQVDLLPVVPEGVIKSGRIGNNKKFWL